MSCHCILSEFLNHWTDVVASIILLISYPILSKLFLLKMVRWAMQYSSSVSIYDVRSRLAVHTHTQNVSISSMIMGRGGEVGPIIAKGLLVPHIERLQVSTTTSTLVRVTVAKT
eukprot:864074_1